MKNRLVIWMFLIVVPLLAACSTVGTANLLDKSPEPIDKDRLESLWLMDGSVLTFKFEEGSAGHILVFDKDEDKLQSMPFVVAKGALHNYLSVKLGGDESHLLLAYTLASDDDLVFWTPEMEPFAAAVRADRLKGTAEEGGDVLLSGSSEEIVRFLDHSDRLFDYRSPILVRRVPKSD